MKRRQNVDPRDFCAPMKTAAMAGEGDLRPFGALARRRGELRAFERWRTPTLTAVIDGRQFNTENWSLGGVLLKDVEDRGWTSGAPIELSIGITGGTLRTGMMIVVRHDPGAKLLALRPYPSSPVLMDVKGDCDKAGIKVF
jgi:hypothetical protein